MLRKYILYKKFILNMHIIHLYEFIREITCTTKNVIKNLAYKYINISYKYDKLKINIINKLLEIICRMQQF